MEKGLGTIYRLYHADPQYLIDLLYINFIKPVCEDYMNFGIPRLRGIHAVGTGDPQDETEDEYMLRARAYAAAAKTVVSHWLKRPSDQWPKFFKEIINLLEKSMEPGTVANEFQTKSGKWKVIPVVAYLVEKRFGEQRRKHGLKKFEGRSFREGYLKKK